ncbi:MAG: thioesterase family protein [Polyangiales bacterium]
MHSLEFVYTVTAGVEDIDELGHVSNIVYVRWIQEAARAHSEKVGWDSSAYQEHGGVFVVRKHEIEYRAPAYANDVVALTTWVESWSGASTVRKTRIVRASDGVELARASTQWAFVVISTGRPTRIPAVVVQAFANR